MIASKGALALLRLALRRDRVVLPVWIAVPAVVVAAIGSALADLYPQAGRRAALGATVTSAPALRALTGPVYDTSIGGLTAWRAVTFVTVLAALMSITTVIRHTRADEESGRAELVGACVVGRHAIVAATVLLAGAANLVLALVTALVLAAQGLSVAGSLAFGLAAGGAGWVFAGVAVVAAQLTEHARTGRGLAVAALGLAFVLRASGDATGDEAVSWLSPLGWAQRVRPFAGERWWAVALLAGTGLALVAVAAVLAGQRDLGAGLVAPRHGPRDAGARLASTPALAWRLQRGSLLGWSAAFAVAGGMFGSLAQSVGTIIQDNPRLAAMLALMGGEGALVDTFLATVLGLLGLVAGGYAVQATLRLRTEESALRAEPVLATAVRRASWTAGHLGAALAGTVVILAAGGLAAGLTHGIRAGGPAAEVPRLVAAAVLQAPAGWTLAGLAMLLFGALPRLVALAWAALVAFALIAQLGELLRLDDRVMSLSPFTHLPQLPGGTVTAGPLLWLTGVAAALAVAGVLAFGARDVSGD
ncbi:ABC-2 type transport system permease protein [Nonomuraea solani]|uniref:ABC-2 type transport system permease protein n=1 Tax=Nonomuraea solani TaxID=1144553 RepID=A0A1H6EIQ5_9ACTN|nr:ABC transporter permease [Nonomuraea solani]SEG96836.1 ABC-2 type transport system permease protein [Nonomuraea solani]